VQSLGVTAGFEFKINRTLNVDLGFIHHHHCSSLLQYASSHEPTPQCLPLPSVEGCGHDHQHPQQGSQPAPPLFRGMWAAHRRSTEDLGNEEHQGGAGSGRPRWCVTEMDRDICHGPFSLIFPPQTNPTGSLKRQVATKKKTATTTTAETTITGMTTTTSQPPPRPYPTPTVQPNDE
jgi:hypothetical protein